MVVFKLLGSSVRILEIYVYLQIKNNRDMFSKDKSKFGPVNKTKKTENITDAPPWLSFITLSLILSIILIVYTSLMWSDVKNLSHQVLLQRKLINQIYSITGNYTLGENIHENMNNASSLLLRSKRTVKKRHRARDHKRKGRKKKNRHAKKHRNKNKKKKGKKRKTATINAVHLEIDKAKNPQDEIQMGNSGDIIPYWKFSKSVYKKKQDFCNLNHDGKILIKQRGLYMIYAQISYFDISDKWAFMIAIDNESFIKCLVIEMGVGINKATGKNYKTIHQCHTSAVTFINSGSTVSLHNLYPERVGIDDTDMTFWGIIKLQ